MEETEGVIRLIAVKHSHLWLRVAAADSTMRVNTLFILTIAACVCLALGQSMTVEEASLVVSHK